MNDKESLDNRLREARENVEEFRSLLVPGLDAQVISPVAKIPFKAVLLREAVLHRICDLADSACLMLESGRSVPGTILARAALETTAVLAALLERVKRAVKDQSVGDLDDGFIMKGLFGRRDEPDVAYAAVNVLAMIDRMDRYFADYSGTDRGKLRSVFDWACESAHPNWLGVMRAYTKDLGNYRLRLGAEAGEHGTDQGVNLLYFCLNGAYYLRDQLMALDDDFRRLCESELTQSTDDARE